MPSLARVAGLGDFKPLGRLPTYFGHFYEKYTTGQVAQIFFFNFIKKKHFCGQCLYFSLQHTNNAY
jgi:hypothetical protein